MSVCHNIIGFRNIGIYLPWSLSPLIAYSKVLNTAQDMQKTPYGCFLIRTI